MFLSAQPAAFLFAWESRFADRRKRPEFDIICGMKRIIFFVAATAAVCVPGMAPKLNDAAHEVAYIAHQGEEALAPSHSKAAYRLAVEHGLDYMKLDVRETKDGHVVMQHDADLWATMRWRERIANLTLAEIRAKGRCRTRTAYTNETIVTLPEALEISKGMRKGVWIDFKHFTPAFAQKVFRLLDEAGYADDRIMVATFTKPALAWVKEHRPNVRRVAHTAISQKEDGFHVNDGQPDRAYATERDLADALDAHGKALGLHGFNLPAPTFRGRKGYDASPELIADLRRRGYWISIWFAYNPEAGEHFRKAGVDALVTNCKANTFRKPATPSPQPATVRVSKDFGFDAEDSTRFLQAALASGAAKVVIDRQASAWVTTSLTGAPNQTVVFEDGVEVRAKPGAFHGRADCLLNYIGCSNVVLSGYGATLRMERSIYGRPPYSKSEHRHTLNIRGCTNLRVEGLTCTESGGDGIFIGGGRRIDGVFHPPADIALKDVKCVRNYRQGLSVIAVRGLVCENCDFSETGGTPPQSGIDFEPNWPDEVLQDIVVRNCRFESNRGRGFEFYLGNLNSKSAPVTARFENCVTRGNVNGFEYQQRRMKYNDLPAGGRVELVGCTFEGASHAGVLIIDKPKASAEIAFRDCKVVDCCKVSTNGPDVRVETRLWDTPPVAGVDFGGLEVRQPFPRAKFSPPGTDWTAPGVTVARLGGFDFAKATVVDPAPGEMRALEGAWPAGSSRIVIYAERKRKVTLRVQVHRLSKRPVEPAKVQLWKDGKRVKAPLPQVGTEPVELSFKAWAAGFWELRAGAGRHALRIIEADVPVAVAVDDRPQTFAMANGSVYFWTDARQPFALFAGADSYEKGAARLLSPAGEEAWGCNPITRWERFQPAAGDVKEGLWRIELVRPKGIHRSIQLDVPGTYGFLFLSKDRYWR